MKQGRRVAVPLALVVLVAGCGGDDDKSNRESSYKPPAPAQQEAPAAGNAAEQDARAKSQARELVTAVEACFVDQQMYTACKKPEGASVPMGSEPGQAEVADATTAGYTVVAHSESGTSFQVEKGESGELTRSCDKPGKGGCASGGEW